MSEKLYIITAKRKGTGDQIYYAWDSDCLSYWSNFKESAHIFSKEPDFFEVISDSHNYMLSIATDIEISEVTITIADTPVKKIAID